jgi:nitrogen fixation/metabolism regulation signal transduction histidine kinase
MTGHEFYLQACEDLKGAAAAGRVAPQRYAEKDLAAWAEPLRTFWSGGEQNGCVLEGAEGDRVDYCVRRPGGALVYSRTLPIPMKHLSEQYRRARDLVYKEQSRDLPRGFISAWILLASLVWLGSLVILALLAHHLSRPIQQLTAGLSELAAGNFAVRLKSRRDDEIGRAIEAFNDSAERLEHSRDRLIYLTQLASWESLARKMAHEVKNSLTPIRLTVEEMVARQTGTDRGFLEQAAAIVVEEIESLERRVRAFSQFSAEPPIRPTELNLNTILEDRVAFLKTGHPEINYAVRLEPNPPRTVADEDLVKGILVNLLENAAQAAGPGGNVLAITHASNGHVAVEIHDSGPGLSEQARRTLFQPTISFKKNGMGLGLSIARKSALLSGGDIVPVSGELGGAAFRLVLPNGSHGLEKSSDC